MAIKKEHQIHVFKLSSLINDKLQEKLGVDFWSVEVVAVDLGRDSVVLRTTKEVVS